MAKGLDELDLKILQILMNDANASFVDIAKEIYVSPPTVHIRVKNLKAQGLILSSHTIVDLPALGFELTAFLFIHLERSSYYTDVLLALREIREITNVHFTTGQCNIMAKVVCRDNKHFNDLLIYRIQDIKGIQRVESFLSLDEPINRQVDIQSDSDFI